MVLAISSGLQNKTFGFERDGLDRPITLLAWLFTLASGGELGTGALFGALPGSNWGGRELKGNLSKVFGNEYCILL